MSLIRKLFSILKEESVQGLPKGRKSAKPGVGWDKIPVEMKQELDDDLIEYFELPPKKRIQIYAKKFAFFEEGGKVHVLYKEQGSGTELEAVWNGKKWDHETVEPDPARLENPPEVDLFGKDEDEEDDPVEPVSTPQEPETASTTSVQQMYKFPGDPNRRSAEKDAISQFDTRKKKLKIK